MTTYTTQRSRQVVFLLVTCIFLSITEVAFGQNARLYTAEHGLTSSRITFIQQDKDGFIWVGTEDGLNRLVGEHIQPHLRSTNKPTSLSNNDITDLHVDDLGTLWIGTGKGLNRYSEQKGSFERIVLSQEEINLAGFSIASIEKHILPGKLLIATSGRGVYVFDTRTLKVDVARSAQLNQAINNSFIGRMTVDQRGWLWLAISGKGLTVVDLNTMQRIEFPDTNVDYQRLKQLIVHDFVHEPNTGNMYIGSGGAGLFVFDAQTKQIKQLASDQLGSMNIQSLMARHNGQIWIGSENRGIWSYNQMNGTAKREHIPNNVVDLDHSKVHSLIEDNLGNIWAGLYQKGVFVIPSGISGFNTFSISDHPMGKNRASITSFVKDFEDNIWIATDGGGVFQAQKSDFWDILDKNKGLGCNSILALTRDTQGRIWAGSYGHGVYVYDGNAFSQPDYLQKLSDDRVMCLAFDSTRNQLFIGTNGGRLNVLDLNTNAMSLPEIAINKWVRTLFLDRYKRLWIGTAEGAYYYDIDRNQLFDINIGIAGQNPTNTFVETDSSMFIGCSSGMIEYLHHNNTHRVIATQKEGESNNIMSMALCKGNALWYATTKGLYRVNLKSGHTRNYATIDGFHMGEFRYGSVLHDDNGMLYFGGDNGVIRIDPTQVNKQQYRMRPIYFTNLIVNNKRIEYNDSTGKKKSLKAPLMLADKVSLAHNENSLVIQFSALEYGNPQKVNYSYRLKGYDPTWIQSSSGLTKATYSSIKPGTYVFEVRGFFDEESINVITKRIQIVIGHPWYSHPITRAFYLIFFLFLLYLTYEFYKNKQKQRIALELAHYNEQIKEDKLRLFTNIAHEIKTPLSLIISPLKKIMQTNTDPDTGEMHNIMQRNAMRILHTVNQLMDIRKLDGGQLQLHFEENNLNEVIKSIMLSFKNMATVKQISFTIECDEQEPIHLWMDNNHFDKIIYNVLSNAFKHTPLRGRIRIRLKSIKNTGQLPANIKELVELRVFNSGKVIDSKDIHHIFDRFYQANNNPSIGGSGVGLHLTHELVRLHHGRIQVQNINEEGVEFIIHIPFGNAHLTEAELTASETNTNEASDEDVSAEGLTERQFIEEYSEESSSGPKRRQSKRKCKILVADDDVEFRNYISKELPDYYIITAESGNDAWKKILSSSVDLVITDYLMPDGDGLELCNRIKSNPETDSIPVIMLTSEDSESTELKSIQQHADRFLSKPLNITLLKGAISQAIRVRERILKKMQRTEMGYNYDTAIVDAPNDKLVKKVVDYIKDNLENPELNVSDLSAEVGISRVHLNRKLKDILGITPSALIRSIRLKQAAYLLVNNIVNISEVAYRVGYSSHSYFTYNFNDYFGMSPKEFIIFHTEQQDDENIRKLLE